MISAVFRKVAVGHVFAAQVAWMVSLTLVAAGTCARGAVGEEEPAELGSELLIVDPPGYELGVVRSDREVRREVLLLNLGDAELHLAIEGASCKDCLSLSLDENRIAPGGSAVLTMDFQPRGLSGEQIIYAVIKTGIPNRKNIGIPIRSHVIEPYSLHGVPFMLHAESKDHQLEHWIEVRPNYEMEGTLENDSVDDIAPFDVAVFPHEDGTYHVRVRNHVPIVAGQTVRKITIASTSANDASLTFQAKVFLPPPLHVFPSHLRVAPTDREQLRILFINQELPQPAGLVGVEVPDRRDFAVEFFPGLSWERSRLNVYVYNQHDRKGYIGDVVLVTDHPDYPRLQVPVVVDSTIHSHVWVAPSGAPVGRKEGCGCK